MISRIALPAAALVLAATVAVAQPPQTPPSGQAQGARNLKVLPADIPQERLMGVMRSFTRSLGVQCSFCHAPGNFASDANPHKEVARGMMRMTAQINGELLPPIIGPSEERRVTCATCHRGAAEPATATPDAPGTPASPPPQPQPHNHHHGERG